MAKETRLTPAEVAAARQRRLEAMRLQEIEGNPLTPDEVAMFEMFEREAWSFERRRAHILKQFEPRAIDVGELSEDDLTTIAQAEVPAEYRYLDDEHE